MSFKRVISAYYDIYVIFILLFIDYDKYLDTSKKL